MAMSNDSFNPEAGETTRQRTPRFLFGIALLLLVAAGFWWYSSRADDLVQEASRNTGRGLVKAALLRHHWTKLEVNTDFKTIVEKLGDDLNAERYSWIFLLPASDDGGKPQDSFEVRVLDRFKRGGKTAGDEQGDVHADRRVVNQNGKPEYNYYEPVYATASCVHCHATVSSKQVNEGDLIAVVKVAIPDAETQKSLNKNQAILIALGIATTFLAMFASRMFR
jgi:hypothetical protein